VATQCRDFDELKHTLENHVGPGNKFAMIHPRRGLEIIGKTFGTEKDGGLV
jgi:hypothetical protein